MLFMGNKKYPQENSWEDWLALNGGSANASTCNLFTNYIFDIVPKGKDLLFEALDRFAHNFISPLFDPNASERELNAIENEFNLYKTDDAYRQWLILKRHVFQREDVPYYKFGAGNKKTLDREDINDRLIAFWTQNYVPSSMSLVVLSDVDLDELEEYVVTLFEQISIPKGHQTVDSKAENHKMKNIHVDIESTEITESKGDDHDDATFDLKQYPFRMEPNLYRPVYGTLFRVSAVKEAYSLDLSWALNGHEMCRYDTSASFFISDLLGHEGKGSLCEYLNQKNYLNSLEVGHEQSPEGLNRHFEIFDMNFGMNFVWSLLEGCN